MFRQWKFTNITWVLVASSFISFSVQAALNDTGQFNCYAGGAYAPEDVTDCSDASVLSGQDAHFGRDAEAAAGRLAKVGGGAAGFDFSKICRDGSDCSQQVIPGTGFGDWACTRDNHTGLMWEMKIAEGTATDALQHKDATFGLSGSEAPKDGSCSLGTGNCKTDNYVTAINDMGLCGHNDWRLPAQRELLSILHHGKPGDRTVPKVDSTYFPNMAAGAYWNGDIFPPNLLQGGRMVSFTNGYADAISSTANAIRTVLVQGSPLPAADFEDNGDGTVTDRATGLMWMKCSYGQTYNSTLPGNECEGEIGAFIWVDALKEVDVVNGANSFGYDDWRLPNHVELNSLLDLERNSQTAIDESFFPGTPLEFYVSSTTYAQGPGNAWVVSFNMTENRNYGAIRNNTSRHKEPSILYRLRFVRNAPSNSPPVNPTEAEAIPLLDSRALLLLVLLLGGMSFVVTKKH